MLSSTSIFTFKKLLRVALFSRGDTIALLFTKAGLGLITSEIYRDSPYVALNILFGKKLRWFWRKDERLSSFTIIKFHILLLTFE